MNPVALLDAASLYYRSFYALPESMAAPDGTPVNAVRGYVDTLARIIDQRRPDRLVNCLDADWRPAFRVEALPSYKAHRVAVDQADGSEEAPDSLSAQVPIILEVLDAVGLATAFATGFEADDVIGTLAHAEKHLPVEVITGDRDLFQLVRQDPTPVGILYVGKGWAKAELLGAQEISDKYDLPLANAGAAYADMAILRGDPSDGLPGVTGIGEKTAATLIRKFGSLEALWSATLAGDSAVPTRATNSLKAAQDYLGPAKIVVQVATAAPVELSGGTEIPAAPTNPAKLAELVARWGIGSSVARLEKALKTRGNP